MKEKENASASKSLFLKIGMEKEQDGILTARIKPHRQWRFDSLVLYMTVMACQTDFRLT